MRSILNHDRDASNGNADTQPLSAVKPGQSAIVRGVTANDPALRDRMRAMGLCEGRRLQVLRNGSRLIVMTMGTRIGLSATLARDVFVQPIPSNAPKDQTMEPSQP